MFASLFVLMSCYVCSYVMLSVLLCVLFNRRFGDLQQLATESVPRIIRPPSYPTAFVERKRRLPLRKWTLCSGLEVKKRRNACAWGCSVLPVTPEKQKHYKFLVKGNPSEREIPCKGKSFAKENPLEVYSSAAELEPGKAAELLRVLYSVVATAVVYCWYPVLYYTIL